jgi:hypothetical protein
MQAACRCPAAATSAGTNKQSVTCGLIRILSAGIKNV